MPTLSRFSGGIPAVGKAPVGAPSARAHALRAAFWVLFLSLTVGQRFGVNFGSYSLSLALPAMYLLLVTAGSFRAVLFSLERLLFFGICVGVALASAMTNAERASPASLALLAVMYFPFLFVLEPAAFASLGEGWVMRTFSNLMLFCALSGIAQFYAQFMFHADWLFDFTSYLPSVLQGPSGYNTVIAVGSLHKSNGFFFREPSGYSLFLALGLLLEWASYRRSFRLACLGLALLLTYSGTGLFALLIGLLLPLGKRSLGGAALLAFAGALAYWLFGDALNLSFTVGRLEEFGSERSSAYIRYVAPLRLIGETFFAESWTPWLGHGPGTIFSATPGYEFHDPTWAKLLFEYGSLGLLAFLALFWAVLARSQVPQSLRIALFFAWLAMGGHLLSPEQNFLTLALVGLLPNALRVMQGALPPSSFAPIPSSAPLEPLARMP